jgi:signal transduction histidine kinase/CheY-like chemotaxis protein
MKRKLAIVTALFLTAAAIRVVFGFVYASHNPRAQDGVLDLRGWEGRGTVKLSGEWTFVPGKFLEPGEVPGAKETVKATVPGGWDAYVTKGKKGPYGYGTYRLEVWLPPRDANAHLAIRSQVIRSAHKLYANGKLVGQSGEPGTDSAGSKPLTMPYVADVYTDSDRLVLVMQVSNFHYGYLGGPFDALILGEARDIYRLEQFNRSMSMLFGGVLVLMGVIFAFLYAYRPQNRELLFFGCFLGSYSLFWFSHGEKLLFEWFPAIDYAWQTRIQSLSSLAIAASLLYFVRFMYPGVLHRGFANGLTRMAAVLAVLYTVTPVDIFTRWELLLLIFDAVLFFYWFVMMVRFVVRQENESVYTLVGAFCVLYHGLGHGINYLGLKLPADVPPVEIPVFVLAMCLVLTGRFFQTLKRVETLSERLMQADRIKTEFLANTSHELRTPLHGIINMAQTLIEGDGAEDSQVRKERLELLITTGRRLSYLLDDILEFTRLSEGHLPLRRSAVDVRTAVAGVLEVMQFLTGGKRIALVNEVPETIPPVHADGLRVMQILFNLLHNAIKHVDEGTITVEARAYEAWVEIAVTDTGSGIPESRQDTIFEPFYRGAGDEADDPQGAGLGLAICKKLVDLHGGRIWIESTPLPYTRVAFTLPVAGESVKEADDSPSTGAILLQSQARRLEEMGRTAGSASAVYSVEVPDAPRVLLAEDDPASLKVTFELLAREGWTVTATASGERALHEIRTRTDWDLAILDVMLPHVSGYQLCREIRKRYNLLELPVLFLTARSQPADLLAAFEAGANDYVTKPLHGAELKARVSTILQMKRSVRDAMKIEMALIQAQIKPHFLYNALNTIASLSEVDTDRMRDVLAEFGHYLRSSFDPRNLDRVVPFAKEWELVESYLHIEQARFGERMRVVVSLPDDRSFAVPPLSIQPIVENALRHGILPRVEGGEIRIEVADEGDRIRVRIQDDGVGMTESRRQALLTGEYKGGIGLTNIGRRLKSYYGEGLEIASEPGRGTTVQFRIPKEERGAAR